MVRAFKYAFAGAGVLATGSLVSLIASGAAPMPRPPAVAEVPPSIRHTSAPAAPTAAAPAPTPAPAPVRAEKDEFRNWSARVAKLPEDLGRMGQSLKLGLDEVRNNDMAFCFREMDRGAGEARNALRATDFVLYLEAREGAIDVVDAKVARPGTLPPSVVECCRDVLRGLEVKVFFSVPGERYSYIFEIEA